jgi:hypothetical protein
MVDLEIMLQTVQMVVEAVELELLDNQEEQEQLVVMEVLVLQIQFLVHHQ